MCCEASVYADKYFMLNSNMLKLAVSKSADIMMFPNYLTYDLYTVVPL